MGLKGLDYPILSSYALLCDKLQALLGSEFRLVDAVAEADPSIGAARQVEAGQLHQSAFDAGELRLVPHGVLGHSLFPAKNANVPRLTFYT
jgi:hypothetical protein